MNRTNKVKIDTNPKRVQNPYEHLKRSPGKFDQKVFTEQELLGSNMIHEYTKLYETQLEQESSRLHKQMIAVRRRRNKLQSQHESNAYLRQLRDALNKEKNKRELTTFQSNVLETIAASQPEPKNPATNADVMKKSEIPKSNPDAASKQDTQTKEHPAHPTEKNASLPNITKPQDLNTEERLSKDITPRKSLSSDGERLGLPLVHTGHDKRAPGPMAMLETMSYDIMTCTLPIQKLKRILPEEPRPVQEKWPIMSSYRKVKVLPTVKQYKRRLSYDMSQLHTRINEYFGCEVPFCALQALPSAEPRKQRLLKAISTEHIRLPHIPK